MRVYHLFLFFVLLTSSAYAQDQVLYYSSNWEIAPKDQAVFFRVCNYNTKYLFFAGELNDYTLDSTMIMKGVYSNYGIKEGEFFFYFPSGKLQAQGHFKKGLRDGLWKYYYENGDFQMEVVFTDGTFAPITSYDLNGKKIIDNGTGSWNFEYERYNQKETAIIKGKFENGLKDGTWTCHLSSGELVYREVYKKGEFKSGTIFLPFRSAAKEPFENQFALPYKFEVTEKSKFISGTKRTHYPNLTFLPQESDSLNSNASDNEKIFYAVEQQAQFPGGMVALMKFVKDNLVYPKDARRMGLEGKVFVKFIVDREGAISNIEIMKGINPSMDEEAIRLVSTFPKWNPAKQNGRLVKSQYVTPIYFQLPD